MNLGKPVLAVTLMVLAASCAGCTLMDRESYSLVIRKRAHSYQAPVAPRQEQPVTAMADSNPDPGPDLLAILEPFRPFAYCLQHQSSHILESILAVGISPVEFPLALVFGGPGAAITTGNFILGEQPGPTGKYPVIDSEPTPPPAK